MIVRTRPSLLTILFALRGSVVPRILPQIILVAALSGIIVAVHQGRPGMLPGFNGAPLALLGIALSIFLGFRNSACYDRWWEARRQWGALVSTSRQFARQTLLLPPDSGERARLLGLAISFAQALVPHLRPGVGHDKAVTRLGETDRAIYATSRNPPDALLRLLSEELAGLHSAGRVGDIPWQVLDRSIGDMAAQQAACERLRSTPLPFAYTLLLHRTAYLFCFLLPFGFADTLGLAAPFIAGLVAYAFFGLDALGDELEDPFSDHANALPIAALADTIEINLREALGEADLPPLPKPQAYLLM